MPIDTTTPGNPGWWLSVLSRELYRRRTGTQWSNLTAGNRKGRPGLELLRSYVDGDPPLPHVAEEWREALRAFIRLSRMNYASLVTGAPLDRMVLLGFTTAADGSRTGDAVAGRVFTANDLNLRFADTARHMLAEGDGYMIVGRPDGLDVPLITSEDPHWVITADDSSTGRTRAAIKWVRDEWDARDLVYVYTPGRVDVATKAGSGSAIDGFLHPDYSISGSQWEWDGALSQSYPDAFADLLPVHRFRNRYGVGEFEQHIDVLDRINDGIFDRVVLSKYQSYRQRAVIGLPERYPEGHPKAGEVIDYGDAFLADPGSFWRMPPETEMWESTPVDLSPVRLAVKDDVEGLCAVTGTPLYYTTPDAASGSAEGAATQREAFVFRVEDRRARAVPGLRGVMGDAFRLIGDGARADRYAIAPLWTPAERYSLGERMSAAVSARTAGLPQESVLTDVIGYSPNDLPRLRAERGRDVLYLSLAGVGAAPAPPARPAPVRPAAPAPAPGAPQRTPDGGGA